MQRSLTAVLAGSLLVGGLAVAAEPRRPAAELQPDGPLSVRPLKGSPRLDVAARIRNLGSDAANGVHLRLRLLAAADGTVVAETYTHNAATVPPGGAITVRRTIELTVAFDPEQTYTVELCADHCARRTIPGSLVAMPPAGPQPIPVPVFVPEACSAGGGCVELHGPGTVEIAPLPTSATTPAVSYCPAACAVSSPSRVLARPRKGAWLVRWEGCDEVAGPVCTVSGARPGRIKAIFAYWK